MNASLRKISLLKVATAIALASTSLGSQAANLDGPDAEETIGAGDTETFWVLTNGATLNVTPGGRTQRIEANGSSVNLNGANVEPLGNTIPALALANGSSGVIVNSSLSTRFNPGLLVSGGSSAQMSGGSIYVLNNTGSVVSGASSATFDEVYIEAYSGIQVSDTATLVFNNGTITAYGNGVGQAYGISSIYPGATINVGNSEITAKDIGVRSYGTLNISGSRITATEGTGLFVGTGGNATVLNSDVTGGRWGVDARGNTSFLNSRITATNGAGAGVFFGDVGFNSSIVTGTTDGIVTEGNYTLDVAGSQVEGQGGAAIRVTSPGAGNYTGNITVRDGAQLVGSNGNLLEVEAGTTNFTADNTSLKGNIVADDAATANIALQNNAILTGQLTGVDSLSVASGGTWRMVADSGVTSLALDGGAVEISDGAGTGFHTLTVGTVSGNGTFVMGTNLGVPAGDKLVVTDAGGARGDHLLHVRNTGVEPVAENALTVVETNGGDANFSVVGGAVDIGVYKYYLEKVGDNWQLAGRYDDGGAGPGPGPDPDPDPEEDLTPSARTIIGLHAAAANVFHGEMGTLRQRMGDVRQGKGENGLWGRSFGRDLKGNGAARTDFNQSMWGLQAGAEREVSLGGIPIILGVFGGYSNSKVDVAGQSEGEIDSGYGGLYGTWLGDDGLYVDGLFKVNRFSNDARAVMSDGVGASGDYGVTGLGGQIEIGKTYNLANGWYAEPFAQLAALRIGSFDYQLDNGMSTKADAYGSLQGRIGASFGFNHKLENGSLFQPYVRVALAQEFIDSNKLTINTVEFNNAFSGTRGEVGAGFAYQLNDALQIHADVDFSAGRSVSQNWGGNFALSYRF